MDRLRSLLNLERGEEAPAFLLFLYITLALTCYIIAKAVRDGLFLIKFSALMLPYVYIGIGLVIGFVVSIYVRLSSRYGQAALISGTLIFFILTIAAQWWAVRMQWSAIPWVFYVWTSIFGIIITVQVWTVANSVLDLRQAKRLFPLVSSGGILGSAVGGLLAAALVKWVGTDNLILVLIPLLGLSIVVVQMLTRRYGRSRGGSGAGGVQVRKDFRTLFRTILAKPYLKLLVALLALSAIVTLIIGFQFDVIVQHVFLSKDKITVFKAWFVAVFSLLSFLLQIAAGSRIVEKFQIRVTLLILPLALIGGTGILLAFPVALWAGGVLKGADHTLRYSIDKSTVELLYAPLPDSLKAEVKAVIDMVVQRLADGVGGLLLLFATRVLHSGQIGVGVLNLLLVSLWVWVALRTRKEYVETIRANLHERRDLSEGTLKWAISDLKSITSFRAMFDAKDEEAVLYAIEAALKMDKKEWIPAKLLSHPSPRVRERVIEMEIVAMSERQIQEWVRSEHDSTVQASAIRKACQIARPGEHHSTLMLFVKDADPKVRLAGLVCVARDSSEQAAQTLRDELADITKPLSEKSEEWKYVAEALGEIRHPATIELHIRLLKHPSLRVRKAALRSAARAGQRELVPFLVRMLADRDVGSEARRALQEWGPRILGTLADILKDPREDFEIRRNIPLVLAYIPGQGSVDLLVECLFDDDGLMRYRAIRALGKLRAIDPGLRVDSEKVGLRLREECNKTVRYQQALARLYPLRDLGDLLALLLRDKANYGRERVFRLLGLTLPQKVVYACFQAVREEDPLRKAQAVEYLDNVLPDYLRESMLPLIEEKKRDEKETPDVRAILDTFMKSSDPILRDCVADAVAKGRWPEVSRTATTLS